MRNKLIGGTIALLIVIGIVSTHHDTPAAQFSISPASSQSTAPTNSSTDSSLPAANPAPTTSSSPDEQSTPPQENTPGSSAQDSTLGNNNTYTNVDGNTVHSPADTTDGSVPDGATARCNDGTYSFSQHHSGTCSYHGGVAAWL